MAAWIVVNCKRSLGRVMPAQIRRCLDEADWMTIAESYGIEDEKTVQAALNHFRVESLYFTTLRGLSKYLARQGVPVGRPPQRGRGRLPRPGQYPAGLAAPTARPSSPPGHAKKH